MTIPSLLRSIESSDFEAKAAQGGLPADFWETYSAFANTSGGTIVLGLKDEDDHFTVLGLKNLAKIRTDLFNSLNDCRKISVNLLRDSDVTEVVVDGERLLKIRIPQAPRKSKPVYINNDPAHGTFRQLDRGDYRCTDEMMRRMWAETADVRDGKILPGFEISDLDPESLTACRYQFCTAAPDHVWQGLNDRELLTNLGGWRRDRESGEEGLTLAGLLMFGRERPILDALPRFHVDYRETDPADMEVRWTYRHTVDGRWSPNLFEFYRRTIIRLTRDLAIPFRLHNLQRIDDSHVGEALREALINALIHADHEAGGGIVIVRQPRVIQVDNPGDSRIPIGQALAGGMSDCRNPSLQKMFGMIGLGERAGSGIPRMRRAWEEQMWRRPDLWEDPEVYRTSLLLPMVSLLPESAVQEVRRLYGDERYAALTQDEVLAAITACVEGQVTRNRLATMTPLHPLDIAAMLREMATDGLREQAQARHSVYRLPREVAANSSHSSPSSSHSGTDTDEIWQALRCGAMPARDKRWVPRQKMRSMVIALCRVRPLQLSELAELMDRNPQSLRQQYLIPLTEEGQIRYLYEGEPTHPQQAYIAGVPDTPPESMREPAQ